MLNSELRIAKINQVEKEFLTSFNHSQIEFKKEGNNFIVLFLGLKLGYSNLAVLENQYFHSDIEAKIRAAIRQERDFIKYEIDNNVSTRTLFVENA